jgi:alkaline phosphatase D
MTRITTAFFYLMLCSTAIASTLTHGPMIGHTSHATVRIWVRADEACDFRASATPKSGGNTIFSGIVRLAEEDNFCGSVQIAGMKPLTTYTYKVFLSDIEQIPSVTQEFSTFPSPGQTGVVRVGIGHSLIGPGEQTIWRTIQSQKPDLFILMGDNIYSDSTEPDKQRRMYLQFRADPYFRPFSASTPIYAIWDDHDYGKDNSDRTQPGKERSLKTFNEIWCNPTSQALESPGTWTSFTVGCAEFFLLDVRYHRSPNKDPDSPEKTMLGTEQREWLVSSLAKSNAVFKFPVSGSSWNCGGLEAWNHRFAYEYDSILAQVAAKRIPGIILLGGDQHFCKIGVRPRESWGGYDLHEWMAGQLWTREKDIDNRAFGMITLDTTATPPEARLEFFDVHGKPKEGRRIPYTLLGVLRSLWNSPPGTTDPLPDKHTLAGELKGSSGAIWDALPRPTGETLTLENLQWPEGQ